MRTKGISKPASLLFSAILLSGCNAIQTKQKSADFDQQFEAGQFQAAADTALSAGEITPDGESNSLLWSLQSGSALSAVGQYEFSNKVFDSAELMMKAEDTESLGRKGVERISAAFLNNSVNRYSPTVYDGVMTNTYKAVNDMFLHDFQNARIEFNRAADRQRRAEEAFKEKLAEKQKELAEKEAEAKKSGASKNKSNPFDYQKSSAQSESAVYEQYPELKEWQAYPDYVNPYTDYLHGLYFMLSSQDKSDLSKARTSMRRVAGMSPNNPAVKTDLKVADKLRRGQWSKKRLNPAVWVIFENGLAPTVEETLIPIPLFLVNNDIDYAQIALPKLNHRPKAYPYLELFDGKKSLGKTAQLADIDRVIQTEFKKEFPLKVTEAISSSLVKALIQYQAQKEGGSLGGLVAAIYQAATTHADTRSWSALPKEVQLARVKKPKNNTISINAPGFTAPINIDLPDSRFTVIYVKATTPGSTPAYKLTSFEA
ncbi:COG3014 family protein [Amphritea sp.]|uniref:COG3014 family protein n=1 Tax=Amphritea sp. TaxID=1872502 RepID=UPI003A936557